MSVKSFEKPYFSADIAKSIAFQLKYCIFVLTAVFIY